MSEWFSSPLALGLIAAAAVWLLTAGTAARMRERSTRRQRWAAVLVERPTDDDDASARDGAVPAHTLGRKRFAGAERWLRQAGIRAPAQRLVLAVAAISCACAALGGALLGPRGALVAPIAAIGLLFLIGGRRRASRRARLNAQLPDLLQAIAGALVAGQSFLQALDQGAREIGEPLGGELQIALGEVELGVSLEQALEELRDRVLDDDLELVVDAVLIQRRVGGNLAEVLTSIANTVRERIRIRGEVRSLTGQARLSSWVLSALPIVLGLGLTLLNHEYMAPLLTTPLGHALLGSALVSELIGIVLMRRIANVRF